MKSQRIPQVYRIHLISSIVLISLRVCPLSCQHQNVTISSPFQRLSNIMADQSLGKSSAFQGIDQWETLSSAMLKTFIRTNNMRAYHLDLHSYRPSAKFSGDPIHIDSENLVHKYRCSQHLNEFKRLLESFDNLDPVLSKKSIDALRLADTYGRPESGTLVGNQFWLGDYDNCLVFKTSISPAETIKGQYCLGVAQFPNWNPQDSKTSLKIGLCLPETCTSSMFNDDTELLSTVETMMKYQISQPFNLLKLRQIYCLPHETSKARQYSHSAKTFIIVMAIFISLSLFATAIEYFNTKFSDEKVIKISQERNWQTIFLESFSILRNLEKFLHIREDPPAEKLDSSNFNRDIFLNSITGLKCIGLCWIIGAHTFLVAPITAKNLIHIDDITKTILANIYLSAHLMVDTFFTLSGLLASYFIFKEGIEKIKTNQWIHLTIHRYWRLTPIYLLCYWFTKSVGHLINTGPMWDYMTAESSPRLNCANESWLEAVLHLSDFKSPKEHCVPFAWFIANGIKFWMLTPFFLILIHKSSRQGYSLILGTLLANIVLVTTLAMQSNVDIKSVIEFKPESAENMLNNMEEIYTRPYSRIGAYLIGLLAGHLIYMVDTNQLEVKLSKNTNMVIWFLFSVTVGVLTFVLKIASSIHLDEEIIPLVFGVSSALVRPLWALCTCWLVFALARGQARLLARFLSAKFWQTLVKLSFCGYLVQGEVIAQLYLSPTNSNAFTYLHMITFPTVTIVFTIAISFLMVILLEYPLIGIEELILPKRVKTSVQPTLKDVNLKAQQCEKLKDA